MDLQGTVTVESADLWACVIEKSVCRIGGPKELIGKFKVKALPGNGVQLVEVAVTDPEGQEYKYASGKLKTTKFQKTDK